MSIATSQPPIWPQAAWHDRPMRTAPPHFREPSAETLAFLASENERLELAAAEEILEWAVERYFPRFALATGLGPEGCVIISMLARIEPRVYIFNLDTGYQFPETLALRERIMAKYRIPIHLEQPADTAADYEAAHGGPVYRHDPQACCRDRKVRVLERVAARFEAWATGVRRQQSPTRANAAIVRWDRKFGMVKINPLARWTRQDVWKRIVDEAIPYNPLHDQGYPSIGCWPCTRAVGAGEHERAGRWSGTAQRECGLHTPAE